MPVSGDSPPVEWRADVGGQIDSDAHGVADVGVRKGPWTVQLMTDTVEARLEQSGPSGRAWGAARAELGAAGLMISPWTNGAPDPSRALSASYLGVEAGAVAYGPGGTYAGGSLVAREYVFGAMSETSVPVPAARGLIGVDSVWGVYRGVGHVWVQGGIWGPEVSFHVSTEAVLSPGWRVGPRVEVRAGAASGADDVTRTRLGGLNPYVIPMAGAAWGEWWVDDYAAARLGPNLHLAPGEWTVDVAPVVDGAAFSAAGARQTATGFAGLVSGSHRRFRGELAVGAAPWIPRGEGVSRVSVWLRFGVDWGHGGARTVARQMGRPIDARLDRPDRCIPTQR